MMTTEKLIFTAALATIVLSSCQRSEFPESQIYTLYSSGYPSDTGRNGVATFDLANIPELNGQICQETAAALSADFSSSERQKNKSGKMRYWCEKGRFKK